MKRAAIYARISEDTEGKGLGVTRQTKACQDLAARRGWDVAGEYIDNDVSATRSKSRPEYERLLTDIESGKVQAVVVWALDRLHRRPVELERFIVLTERHKVALANVAGDIDLSTDMGQLQARIMGAVAAQEAKAISRRIRAKQEQLREAGRPFGGGIRCYGWEPDRMTPIPEEQDEIRRMVAWVLDGRSVNSLVRDLNDRGVPTVSQWMHQNPSRRRETPVVGKPWSLTSVRTLLSKPRIAGLLTYKGRIVGEAAWDPIIDRQTFDRVQAALAVKTQTYRKSTNARKYLLSGIAKCGTCDTPLQVGAMPEGKESLRRYRCPVSASGRARGTGVRHGGRNMRHLDGLVIDSLLMAMEVIRFAPPEEGTPPDPGPAIARLRERLNVAADQFAQEIIDGEQLQRISTGLRAKISRLEATRPRVDAETALDWYTGSTDPEEARAAFLDLPLEKQRRALLDTLGEWGEIVVHPAKVFNPGGVGGVDESTIEVTWRWGDTAVPATTEQRAVARPPYEPTDDDLRELDATSSV